VAANTSVKISDSKIEFGNILDTTFTSSGGQIAIPNNIEQSLEITSKEKKIKITGDTFGYTTVATEDTNGFDFQDKISNSAMPLNTNTTLVGVAGVNKVVSQTQLQTYDSGDGVLKLQNLASGAIQFDSVVDFQEDVYYNAPPPVVGGDPTVAILGLDYWGKVSKSTITAASYLGYTELNTTDVSGFKFKDNLTLLQPLTISGDPQWSAWDFAQTPAGISGINKKLTLYKKIGKIVFIRFWVEGYGVNGTSPSFDLPYPYYCTEVCPFRTIIPSAMDNGADLPYGVIRAEILPNTSIITFSNSLGWVGTGVRMVEGCFFYETSSS